MWQNKHAIQLQLHGFGQDANLKNRSAQRNVEIDANLVHIFLSIYPQHGKY